MQSSKRSSLIFVCLIAIVSVSACKKKGNPIPAKYTGCRISRITETPFDRVQKATYYFYYNDDGTVMRIRAINGPYNGIVANFNKYFTYKSNHVYVNLHFDGANYTAPSDSMVLDGENRIDSLNYIVNSNYRHNHYQYDTLNEMILTSVHTYNSDYTDTFSWRNGDMIRYAPGSVRYSYSLGYYDTIYNIGNVNAIISDLEQFGRSTYTSRHLTKYVLYSQGDTVQTYSYTIDSAGKITSIISRQPGYPTSTVVTEIVYACE